MIFLKPRIKWAGGLILFLAALFICIGTTVLAEDLKGKTTRDVEPPKPTEAIWPMFLHDPQHTGRSPYGSIFPAATILWSHKITEVSFRSSPVIDSDGTIYLNCDDGYLYALNSDGALKWKIKLSEQANNSCSPAIGLDGTVYVGSSDGFIYAINPINREPDPGIARIKWKYPEQFDKIYSPNIDKKGNIFICTEIGNQGYLYALNPDGIKKWSYEIGVPDIGFSPTLAKNNDIVYVSSRQSPIENYLYALYSEDGSEKWVKEYDEAFQPSCSVDDCGNIYATTNRHLFAFDPEGNELWAPYELQWGETIYTAPVIGIDGTIHFASSGSYGNGYLYAIQPDGTLKWRYEIGDFPNYSTAAVTSDGTICIVAGDGTFYAFNPEGELKWQYDLGTFVYSPIAIDKDKIVAGTLEGDIYAFSKSNNQAPQIINFSPLDDTPQVILYGTIDFSVTAVDPDNDSLYYTWLLDGQVVSAFGNTYSFTRQDFLSHIIKCVVRDRQDENNPEKLTASREWQLDAALTNARTDYINIEVLVTMYTDTFYGTFSDQDIKRMQEEIAKAREFFFRNSHLKLNLSIAYLIIDQYVPEEEFKNGGLSANFQKATLYSYGVKDNQYAVVFSIFHGKDACFFMHPYLFMGSTLYCQDPGMTDAWEFVHEFHHAIEYMSNSSFLDYPNVHPDFYANFGGNWDINRYILRMWPITNWFKIINPNWCSVKQALDNDQDMVPDNDPSLPIDEARFGSSSELVDTDSDGLTDLGEVMAGMFSASNPNSIDTDGDGIIDGQDKYPLYNLVPFVAKGSPVIDGNINQGEWQYLYSNGFPDIGAEVSCYSRWDDNYLYFALQSPNPLKNMYVYIDALNNGFETRPIQINLLNDYKIYIRPNSKTIQPQITFDDDPGPREFYDLPQSGFMYAFSEDATVCEIAIPRNQCFRLDPKEGYEFGLRICSEESNNCLFETDSYVSLRLCDSIPAEIWTPETPNLLFPLSDQEFINSEMIEFLWSAIPDFNPETCNYAIELSKKETFEDLLTTCALNSTNWLWEIANIYGNTDIYWRLHTFRRDENDSFIRFDGAVSETRRISILNNSVPQYQGNFNVLYSSQLPTQCVGLGQNINVISELTNEGWATWPGRNIFDPNFVYRCKPTCFLPDGSFIEDIRYSKGNFPCDVKPGTTVTVYLTIPTGIVDYAPPPVQPPVSISQPGFYENDQPLVNIINLDQSLTNPNLLNHYENPNYLIHEPGFYQIFLNVCDYNGQLIITDNHTIYVFVYDQNQPGFRHPTIDSHSPNIQSLEVKAKDNINFQVTVSDLDEQWLYQTWKLDGEIVKAECGPSPAESTWIYQAEFENGKSNTHVIEYSAKDNVINGFTVSQRWEVTVSPGEISPKNY